MPLRVLGGMDQQSQHGRRQLEPADSSRFAKRRLRGGAELLQGAIDLALEIVCQLDRQRGRSSGLRFVREERPLLRREGLAAGIGEEPIQAAGGMADMETHRRRSTGPSPEMDGRQRIDDPAHVLHGLEEGVRHRLMDRRKAAVSWIGRNARPCGLV
jgi:hypothetical protein